MTTTPNAIIPSLDPLPAVSGVPLQLLGEATASLIRALIAFVDNNQFADAKLAVSYIKIIGEEAELQLELNYAQSTGKVQ